eukprot:12891222-Prorocentrum_lima.AAC.1
MLIDLLSISSAELYSMSSISIAVYSTHRDVDRLVVRFYCCCGKLVDLWSSSIGDVYSTHRDFG